MHKYPHFENDFKTNNLDYWLRVFPELSDAVYIASEKIHGANVPISVSPQMSQYTLGSRTRVIPEEEDFHTVRQMIQTDSRLLPLMEALHTYSDEMNDEVTIYGEVFGPGVTPKDGPYYGETKNIRFFDIRVGESLIPYIQFEAFFTRFNLNELSPRLYITPFKYFESLEEALEFDVKINSIIPPNPELIDFDNLIEGVVIKPYYTVYVDAVGKTFMLKKKNKRYLEKTKPSKEIRKQNPTVTNLQEILISEYLNQNRIDSVFSKYGVIENEKKIGQYIRLIIDDIREDFGSSDDARLLVSLDEKDTKQVFNIGKSIVPYLKAVLHKP